MDHNFSGTFALHQPSNANMHMGQNQNFATDSGDQSRNGIIPTSPCKRASEEDIFEDETVSYYVRMDQMFCILTGVLFSVGIFANAFTLKRVLWLLRKDPAKPRKHIFFYISALAATDLSLLLNCPFVIHDVASAQWGLGIFVCKIIFTNDSLNKLLTGFLVSALTVDQMIDAAGWSPKKWRTLSVAKGVIGSSLFISSILMIPLFIYTKVVTFVQEQHDVQAGGNLTTTGVQKCAFAPPLDMAYLIQAFTLTEFAAACCLPAVCIAFSCAVIGFMRIFFEKRKLECNAVQRPKFKTHRKKSITKYVCMLIICYLCCSTPYWVLTLDSSFGVQTYHSENNQLSITYTLLYIQLLPYLNSVLNALVYIYAIECSPCHRKEAALREGVGSGVTDGVQKIEKWPLQEVEISREPTHHGEGDVYPMAYRDLALMVHPRRHCLVTV